MTEISCHVPKCSHYERLIIDKFIDNKKAPIFVVLSGRDHRKTFEVEWTIYEWEQLNTTTYRIFVLYSQFLINKTAII